MTGGWWITRSLIHTFNLLHWFNSLCVIHTNSGWFTQIFFLLIKNMPKPFREFYCLLLECLFFSEYKQANALIFKLMKAVEMRHETIWKSYASFWNILMKSLCTHKLLKRLSVSYEMKSPLQVKTDRWLFYR